MYLCFMGFQAAEHLERYEEKAIYEVVDWNKKKKNLMLSVVRRGNEACYVTLKK